MQAGSIARLLPEIYREGLQDNQPGGDVLVTLLAVMEALHAPAEAALDTLDATFDPRRTVDAMVPALAAWVDLERYVGAPRAGSPVPRFAAGTGRLRELAAQAADLARWRGTAAGLARFLAVATGVAGFEVDDAVPGEDGRPRPFHVRVRAPAALPGGLADLVRRIVEQERPAYATYEVEFGPAGKPPPEPDAGPSAGSGPQPDIGPGG